jgi:hypothetical protein
LLFQISFSEAQCRRILGGGVGVLVTMIGAALFWRLHFFRDFPWWLDIFFATAGVGGVLALATGASFLGSGVLYDWLISALG